MYDQGHPGHRGRSQAPARAGQLRPQLQAGNDSSTIEVQYGTIETPDGQVLRLDTRTLASQQVIRVHGDVIDGKMTLKIENGGQQQEKVDPLGRRRLRPLWRRAEPLAKPIKPGEVRKVKTFIPDLNKIGEVNAHRPRGSSRSRWAAGPTATCSGSTRTITSWTARRPRRSTATLWVDDRRPGPQDLHRRQRRDGHLPDHQGSAQRATRRSST